MALGSIYIGFHQMPREVGESRLPAVGEAPHTMPPVIRKTAVSTKRRHVIEVYPRSAGAPMPLSHHETTRRKPWQITSN